MQRLSHLDRLRLLGGIVKPISETLAEQALTLGDFSDDTPNGQSGLSNLGSDSGLSQPASSFLSSLADQDANTQPMGLSPEAMTRQVQLPGRLFEYLRQTVLQRSAEEFTDLPIRLQAIARMGGLIYTERHNLEPRTYHLLANGVLLGILDRRKSRFYSRRQIPSMDLSDLHCVIRPAGVDKPSSDMELMPVLDLPAEMGTHWLHLRKLPSVSTHLLLERHLSLIRLLLIREHLFDQLLRSMPKKDPVHLLRDLASLLLTRAIEPLPAHVKHSGLKPGLPYTVSVVKR